MQWRGEASACLSHAVLRFTEDQDLRVTAGRGVSDAMTYEAPTTPDAEAES